MRGRVLIVAGSDSGGGAGIQGDIKTVTALTGYAATAITALTAQNTLGVFGIHPVPVEFIAQQMRLVLEDIGADAIKTGMLHSGEVIDTVADVLEELGGDIPLVVDPVMVAKGGALLLDPDASHALQRRLLPRADVITPNIPEAQVLSGLEILDLDDMRHAANLMLSYGPKAVLLKGGHMEGETVTDLLVTNDGEEVFTSRRIDTLHTHGTGCTLASAIATGLAQRLTLPEAVTRARNYVDQAIRQAPGYGGGHGPLNHAWTVADGF
ncbi:bifunctional hydroxymethylpyrimidine kinase/phosphomethylpyrimidine kinase [Skermanella mucosa]|uniref:bifunctional hydroxymethylpyrimidine kinase/phosphomethylpyrimidine kinase n=1 Tax=Skermanella mucosa TaxID=1789672 RepID=UPI00192CA60F|nr:bifunctional hydroxymethylpyrimidine kinase/phosphomethylpyrimidine kinase [Skermanella mucosa]UEM23201.1 bifunctional hydroxymethylpyrimidine kinase/phosphomethylpyrimidine kinase [Skermanella mucosa]